MDSKKEKKTWHISIGHKKFSSDTFFCNVKAVHQPKLQKDTYEMSVKSKKVIM